MWLQEGTPLLLLVPGLWSHLVLHCLHGVGSSFVGPSLLEQHQSPDGSFLVSRGTSLRRCLPFCGTRSTDVASSRSFSQSWVLVGDAADEVVPAGDVDVLEDVVVDTDFSEPYGGPVSLKVVP